MAELPTTTSLGVIHEALLDSYHRNGRDDGTFDYTVAAKNQISSYNDFINVSIPMLIASKAPIEVTSPVGKYIVHISNPAMGATPMCQVGDTCIKMTPYDARMRNMTYSSYYIVKLTQQFIFTDKSKAPLIDECELPIGKIPVMLQSQYCVLNNVPREDFAKFKECYYDPGGYFIIRGGERVIVAQERQSDRRVMCHKKNQIVEILSTIDQRVNAVTRFRIACMKTGIPSMPQRLVVLLPKPFTPKPFNLFILFRLFGIETDADIMRMIMPDVESSKNSVAKNILYSTAMTIVTKDMKKLGIEEIRTQADAFEFMKTKVVCTTPDVSTFEAYVTKLTTSDILPHTGQSTLAKCQFISYMAKKLLDCLSGVRPWDDRDSFVNKRVDGAGPQLMKIFRTNVIAMYSTIAKKAKSIVTMTNPDLNAVKIIIKEQSCSMLTQKLRTAMLTGNWSITKAGGMATKATQGVSQILNRLSLGATLAHIRHVQSPTDPSSKVLEPRYFNMSSINMICPDDTPESSSIGLAKNLALTCEVTVDSDPMPTLRALVRYSAHTHFKPMAGVIAEEMAISTRVMVNGDLVGIIRNENANTAVQCLRALRRHGHIAGSISIAWDCFTNEISILTDGGRFSYPALIVNSTFNDVLLDLSKVDENNHPIVNWSEAVAPRNTPKAINLYNGATIEYLDAAESDTIMMAESLNVLRANSISNPTYKTYTHCFLSPHAVKGIMSAKIPFADMNQGARNCFVSNMGKQVIGRYVSNIHDRMDNTANELVYPNLPICQTNSNKYFGLDYLLHGCMSMVAMMSMGINQEDALVINGDSVSSLFMSSIYYRVYEDKLKSVSNTREQFNVPPVAQIKFVKEGLQRSFDKGIIDATTGFPHLKRRITGGDVIIPKYIEAKGEKFVDASTYVRINEGGIISKIVPGPDDQKTDEDGNYFCKVQTAELRKVDTGHKMATTSAQKGIVGAVTSSVDLPSTGNGITPELVMNPHGIPSRMTVSQMAECYISQVAMVTGKFYDATPFNHFSHDEFKELHKRYGLDIAGERIMYDGITGMQIKTPIFIGPLYYTRLKHMVEDKIHYRTEVGPVQLRTRQPSEGRSRNGGLRLGEMERDCFVAHGVAAFLRERMMNSSDMFKIHVGTETGAIIPSNPETNFYQYDGKFDDKEEIVEVQLPFASVVFLHTLNACGIEANIKTE